MTETSRWIGPLCRADAVPEGQSRGLDPLGEGRDTMSLLRRGGVVHGYRNACPHYDHAPMAWRKDQFLSGDGSMIRCSAHGALFDIEDGLCTAGPCVGQRLQGVSMKTEGDDLYVAAPFAPGRRPRSGGAARTSR